MSTPIFPDIPEFPTNPPVVTEPEPPVGSTAAAGRSLDDSKGRKFPCERCGADFEFHIGEQSLRCPFCHHVKQIAITDDDAIVEQDLKAMLTEIRSRRERQQSESEEVATAGSSNEVDCDACGATVVFEGTLISSECAYCGSPIQLGEAHAANVDRIPVDAVLPFKVSEKAAGKRLVKWVTSRWFAPNSFKEKGGKGRFAGVYLPYWTYDAMTYSRYAGQRGEYYYVTVSSTDSEGNTTTRQERRTRWYPASGHVQRFFDDVLVCATTGLPSKIISKLEPWQLNQCLPFTGQALAGFQARTYDVELDKGFQQARVLMDVTIRSDVCRDIGGDTQSIDWVKTRYDATTFKHVLLPLWLLSYRYNKKVYQVLVNAQTGEVQGERPYSWIKITLAVVATLALAGGVIALGAMSG